MATPVLGRQRQLDQRRHRTLDAQQRVSHLEQRVRPRKQTVVEHLTKPAEIIQTHRVRVCTQPTPVPHNGHLGHRPPPSRSVIGTRRRSSGGRPMSCRHATISTKTQIREVKEQAQSLLVDGHAAC